MSFWMCFNIKIEFTWMCSGKLRISSDVSFIRELLHSGE